MLDLRAVAIASVIVASLLSACSGPQGPLVLEGRVAIIGPSTADAPSADAPVLYGAAATTIRDEDGVVALEVSAGALGAAIGRHLDTPLLAMPYLSWGWLRGRDGGAEDVPLRIRVGFAGGSTRHRITTTPPWLASLTQDLPTADRYVDFVWRAGASLPMSWIQLGGVPGLVMRNSGTSIGAWRLESVDLSAIHARLWPRTPLGETVVVSVFLFVEPGARGSIAELALSR